MKNTIEIKSSGIHFVDKNWGGFYTGSTYLINGQPKSGKTSTALQYAYNIASRGEVCVYFTNIRPRKLILNAYSQGLNLQPLIDDNKLIILRMSPLKIDRIEQEKDAYLSEFLYEIIKIADEFNPSGIVFDELTPYLGFTDKDMFLDVFNEVVEALEDSLVTTVFVLKEATSTEKLNLAKQLEDIVNGVIDLNDQDTSGKPDKKDDKAKVGYPNSPFMDQHRIRLDSQFAYEPGSGQNECYEQAPVSNLLLTKRPDNYYEPDQVITSAGGL